MSGGLIIFVGLIYLIVAVDLYFKGQSGMSLAFLGYALANVGLWKATQ